MTSQGRRFALGTLESFTVPAWLATDDRQHGADWWNGKYFVEKARRLEAAKLDFMFFLDTLAVRRRSDGSMAGALRYAATAPQHDPMYLLPLIAGATEHIGLIATASTTFYNPYQLARAFSTIDSLSNGRAGWNIVTSYEKGEALNFGLDDLPSHDERYDRADEYLDLVKALWQAWDPDALVADLDDDTYIDPSKVHEVDFEGHFYRSRGPLNTLRSPQGVPFLAQAGASERGRDFAAKHAELTFAIPSSVDESRAVRDDLRDRASHAGRNPDDVRVVYGCNVIFESPGWDRKDLPLVTDTQVGAVLEQMSQGLNLDLSAFPLDKPLPADLPPSGLRTMFDLFIGAARQGQTLRESLVAFTKPRLKGAFRGTPEEIANQMLEFMDGVGGDGIMITNEMATNAEFLDLLTDGLIPILRAAGAIRSEYLPGATLRESLRALR
ncbi:MAG TPA: NtaA/DmoA family FMN-dependent monooxygenase [Pseudolysinimonas sp.]|nr:NtaA/DmoA family FMN-dependent monooxygenase [Pseudolysinimonas sp.]